MMQALKPATQGAETDEQDKDRKLEEISEKLKETELALKLSEDRISVLETENSSILEALKSAQMKEKNLHISSLTAEVGRLSAEVESLKSQLNLDERLAQHSEKMYVEENRAFERLKQKIESDLVASPAQCTSCEDVSTEDAVIAESKECESTQIDIT
nr:unnamed protein product [Spirometra erinaceieuropaei]